MFLNSHISHTPFNSKKRHLALGLTTRHARHFYMKATTENKAGASLKVTIMLPTHTFLHYKFNLETVKLTLGYMHIIWMICGVICNFFTAHILLPHFYNTQNKQRQLSEESSESTNLCTVGNK